MCACSCIGTAIEKVTFRDAESNRKALTYAAEVTVAGSGDKWRWADRRGVQRLVHSDELRAALASGALPPYTLVWRVGMHDWLPAYQVAELATVAISAQQGVIPNIPPPPLAMVAVQAEFERRAVEDRAAREDVEPPPPPVQQYDHIAAAVPEHVMKASRDSVARLVRQANHRSAASDASPVLQVSPSLPTDVMALSVDPPTVPLARAPRLPEDAPPISEPAPASPLRAPPSKTSAGPPPPPRRSRPAPSSLPPPKGLSLLPTLPTVRHGESDVEPGAPVQGRSISDLPAFPFEQFDEDPPDGQPIQQPVVPPSDPPDIPLEAGLFSKAIPWASATWTYVKAHPRDPKVLGAAGGLAALVLVPLLIASVSGAGSKSASNASADVAPANSGAPLANSGAAPSVPAPVASVAPQDSPPPAASATAAPSEPAPSEAHASASACRLAKSAQRLAPRASKDVPLEVVVSASGERARVGFATDTNAPWGVGFDENTLKVATEFAGRPGAKIRAVIPGTLHGKATYIVNAEGKRDKLKPWRSLSIDPPWVVGFAKGGIAGGARATDGPRALWKLDGDDAPDALRTVVLGDDGALVAFRRSGGIFVGSLVKNQPTGEGPQQVTGAGAPPGSPVGSPALATNGSQVAIAFADRASASVPWALRIGVAPVGSVPSSTVSFAVPAGGPGGAALAPALVGLSDSRWLLVWTEGSGGSHDVRAQTLSSQLAPLGEAFTVSKAGANAGQGAAAVAGGQGLVAYLSLTDKGYELWGASIDCR